MKLTTVLTLSSLLLLGITGQAQAVNHQSTVSSVLANQKYMMSAHLMNNKGSRPDSGSGRRNFVETSQAHSEENSMIFRRGSGR